MKIDVALDDVQPSRLRAAVAQALEQHKGTAAAPTPVDPQHLAALRQRLAQVADDPQALPPFTAGLSPADLRGLISGLEHWAELRATVASILRQRARASFLPQVWRVWQRCPKQAAVRDLLIELGDRFDWQTVTGLLYAGLASRCVRAQEPGTVIQAWLDAQGLSYSDMQTLTQWPFLAMTPLTRLVRDAVMVSGSRAQLEAEGTERLMRWQPELGPQLEFGQNYLLKIPDPAWQRPIIDWIEQTYGLPRKGIRAFWDPLPEHVRQAFQRLFIERKLQTVLGHDTERHSYWNSWVGDLVDISKGVAGTVDFAILDFGTFGVVEFFETGNAAYFYPAQELDDFRRSYVSSPSVLKERRTYPFEWGDENRLLHTKGTWQWTCNQKVRRWLQATRQ